MKEQAKLIGLALLSATYFTGSIVYLMDHQEMAALLLFFFVWGLSYGLFRLKLFLDSKQYASEYVLLTGLFGLLFICIYMALLLLTGLQPAASDMSVGTLLFELLIITIIPLVLVLWYLEISLFQTTYKSITIRNLSQDQSETTDITISSDASKKELVLDIRDLLLIEAEDNYSRVYLKDGAGVKKVLFRSTLKKMHDQLAGVDNIFRCHRSYLINANSVESISGKAQNYRLKISGVNKQIPVSRSFDIEQLNSA